MRMAPLDDHHDSVLLRLYPLRARTVRYGALQVDRIESDAFLLAIFHEGETVKN